MKNLRNGSLVTIAYLAVVLLAASWAIYTDARYLHSVREHLAPDILLLIVTLPSSLSLSYLYDAWPEFFSKPFTQVVWVTCCGLLQVCLLFTLVRLGRRFANSR